MHSLYFVKLKKERADTPEDAITETGRVLAENSFTYDSGAYFGSGKADWYIVGGRWSGILQEIQRASNSEDVPRNLGYRESDLSDAAPITAEMLQQFRGNPYYTDVEVFDPDAFDEVPIADLQDDAIGDWIVVIDYHN